MPRTLQAGIEDLLLKTHDPKDITVEDDSGKALSITIQPKDVPALSAWLLEYPVGYTFSGDSAVQSKNDETAGAWQRREEQTNLDDGSYDLLAFSYPSKLLGELGWVQQATRSKDTVSTAGGEEVGQFLQRIPVRLKERYESRLGVLEYGKRPEIEVTTERVRLEKVVL
ncbi:hypothetical protein QFC22_002388 [Naganishia vaughanmartiniae]|uniref:Uncharacterized protein n=1 Tax=Naganishia vaughanmartiniae TaxID=1424756 RepID=A0ACC2XFF7_9TREE|nr:hypothetical protein QFC22_002388 [Naganishia vaughanmartiniae]